MPVPIIDVDGTTVTLKGEPVVALLAWHRAERVDDFWTIRGAVINDRTIRALAIDTLKDLVRNVDGGACCLPEAQGVLYAVHFTITALGEPPQAETDLRAWKAAYDSVAAHPAANAPVENER